MKITIETPLEGAEDEIVIRVKELTPKVMSLIQSLKSDQGGNIAGYLDDKIVMLPPKDIYYFESVDDHVYAYLGKGVYEVRKKLYEIEEEFNGTDYLRVSKAVIVNVSKIAYIKPNFNGRFEARLKNDEKIIISRQYVALLKQKLGL